MRSISVKCPTCGELIEIDAQSGQVIRSHPAVKAAAPSLDERLRELAGEKSRREQMVAESRSREEQRRQANDEIFRKVREQAKEGPPAERPLRDIDID